MTKLTDYVAEFLAARGVRCVFGVTGGAVVHIFDSIARRRDMRVVFTHHEQSAAFAAEAHGRAMEGLGVGIFTTGPGGTNALTGLAAAWLDSLPCLFLSGQTRRSHTTEGLPIRQLGTQQLDIVRLVQPMTKYAAMLSAPGEIRHELEKAVHLATSGRPGPVWIDIPLDFQWAMIEPAKLPCFKLPSRRARSTAASKVASRGAARVASLIAKAHRPLLILGGGVRLGGGGGALARLLATARLPFLTTWGATDLVPTGHSLCLGRPGMFGQRGANMAPSACDLLVTIGSHLPIPVTGTRKEVFAPQARKVMVDIDADELKHAFVPQDLRLRCEAREFLDFLERELHGRGYKTSDSWRRQCGKLKALNQPESKAPRGRGLVDPYRLVGALSKALRPGDSVVVDGGGTINQITFQTFECRANQRLIISGALCAMGSGLPESIGVALARPRGQTVLLCGDGSFQFNIQELQTLVDYRIALKIFVINNGGYLSIRHTQAGFLEGRFTGSTKQGGVGLPDFRKVAAAYGLKTTRLTRAGDLVASVRRVLAMPGAVLCEVPVSPNMEVLPRPGFEPLPQGGFRARPFDDMHPALSLTRREELLGRRQAGGGPC